MKMGGGGENVEMRDDGVIKRENFMKQLQE